MHIHDEPAGTSHHRYEVDGNRLRLHLVSTDLGPTNGVPDTVYREVFYDDIVYRWDGPITSLPKFPGAG